MNVPQIITSLSECKIGSQARPLIISILEGTRDELINQDSSLAEMDTNYSKALESVSLIYSLFNSIANILGLLVLEGGEEESFEEANNG